MTQTNKITFIKLMKEQHKVEKKHYLTNNIKKGRFIKTSLFN